MKIAYIISSLVYGGAETQIIALCNEMAGRNHDVTLISLSDLNPREGEVDHSVKFVVLGKKKKLDWNIVRSLRKYIKENDIEIVHTYLFDSEVHARIALINIPTVLINSERNWNYSFTMPQACMHHLTRYRADCLIANSYSGLRFALKRYKMQRITSHAIWNGIDLDTVEKRLQGNNINHKVEFFADEAIQMATLVGSIKEDKDYLFALSVADEWLESHGNWRVVFVGEKLATSNNDYHKKVEEKYSRLRHKDKMRFVGNRNDVLSIISQSQILFSTSNIEGFPNVVLEAMAVGTPVVSTQYSDIELILPHRKQIAKDRSVADYIDSFNYVHQNRVNLIEEQAAFVGRCCSIQAVADKHENVYRECRGRYV